VLYSLVEIEDLILGPLKPSKLTAEYLLLTEEYLSSSHEKSRINRLLQVAKNRNVKTRVVDTESKAGLRLKQLGGMVSLARLE
jgi:stalled ribosome rescue protein Dom34